MILSDRDIREAIETGRIAIEPFDPADVQPSSVDLHCDRYFRTFHNARYPYIDVKKPMDELTELIDVKEDEPFILHPGEFVLGSTLEYVKLPSDLVARLEGKSSLGRLGLLIHSSLPGDEEVLYLHEGEARLRKIGEIVSKRLEGCVASFDPVTFRVDYHEVTGWWEGAPDRIFEIVLASGRKVQLTGGHDLFSLDSSGEICKIPIHSLAVGQLVAIPRRIPDPLPGGRVTLNLADLAPERDYQNLVCGGPTVEAAWASDDQLSQSLRAMGIGHHDYYRNRHLLPFAAARLHGIDRLLGRDDFVSAKGSRHRIPARIDVDPDLAWLLGLYVAEGYVRRNQVTISNTDQAILDRGEGVFYRLGLPVYRMPGAITCCSAVIASLIEWLGMGGRAREKRLPSTVLGWPRVLLEAFLEGFIDGDGSRESTRISLWSGSDRLVEDLLLLAERLELRASASRRDRLSGSLWQISIPYREHKMLTSVPLCSDLLIELRMESKMSQRVAAHAAGFKHASQLNNIERRRWPRIRMRTLRALREVYARNDAGSPRLDRIVDGDLCWDEVAEIRDTGRVEPVFDLEVRPNGRKIENFLAGRGGIFVSNTAGYVDPGFEGHLTLELSNVANLPITIYPGMKIGQISFFSLSSEAENPYGSKKVGSKYQGQRGPTPSRFYENFD